MGKGSRRKRVWRRMQMLGGGGVKLPIALISSAVITASSYYTYRDFKERLKESVPTDSVFIDPSEKRYIYPNVHPWSHNLKRALSWIPNHYFTKPLAFMMFEEISSANGEINEEVLKNFATLSYVLEGECEYFASLMDFEVAIALARAGADPRLFLSPNKYLFKKDKNFYVKSFRDIFVTLPTKGLHDKMVNMIKRAFILYNPSEEEGSDEIKHLEYYSRFDPDFYLLHNPEKGMPQPDFLKICLLGTLSHSRFKERIKDLISLGVLDLLVLITREYKNDTEIMAAILRILANLSCDPETSGGPMLRSGCLRILVENAQEYNNVKLLLPAKRALHNLDRRKATPSPILPTGTYQLHPEHDCDSASTYDYDVIFIHGLLGGVSRTWRRNDNNPATLDSSRAMTERETKLSFLKSRLAQLRSKTPLTNTPTNSSSTTPSNPLTNPDATAPCYCRRKKKGGGGGGEGKDCEYEITHEEVRLEVEDIATTPTSCWPRDWLPQDLEGSRIIAMDFETFVSEWMTVCPVETSERRLKDRAGEILKKLHTIGVGDRPVVFVTHSMGGLLLKSLLCQASESKDDNLRKICENTKGVVFCSVPHLGTEHAVLSAARKWLLLPTEEIEELANRDKQLTQLNECFLGLMEKYGYKILSFGEILETRTGMGMTSKLVPYQSADIGVGEFYPLPLDHLGTCKPWSRGSFLYLKIVEFIRDSCESLKKAEVPTPTPSPILTLQDDDESSTTTNPIHEYLVNPTRKFFEWISHMVFPD